LIGNRFDALADFSQCGGKCTQREHQSQRVVDQSRAENARVDILITGSSTEL
jgi:hypothetical protein